MKPAAEAAEPDVLPSLSSLAMFQSHQKDLPLFSLEEQEEQKTEQRAQHPREAVMAEP
jgi:hypothetical protein